MTNVGRTFPEVRVERLFVVPERGWSPEKEEAWMEEDKLRHRCREDWSVSLIQLERKVLIDSAEFKIWALVEARGEPVRLWEVQ